MHVRRTRQGKRLEPKPAAHRGANGRDESIEMSVGPSVFPSALFIAHHIWGNVSEYRVPGFLSKIKKLQASASHCSSCRLLNASWLQCGLAPHEAAWLVERPNLRQEPYDFIGVTNAMVGLAGALRRVVGIQEVWNSETVRMTRWCG